MTDNKCPNCGRILVSNADGRIGKCVTHGWFPLVEGAEVDAAKRNADEKSAKERERLQAEADRQRAIREEREKHHKKVAAIIGALAVVAVIALGSILFFVVRPGMDYRRASQNFENGSYDLALDGYTQLGNFKDSRIRASLCEILMSIQNENNKDAINAVNELVLDGSPDTLSAFANAASPILTGWKEKDLPPELVIAILNKIGDTPLQNNLDSATLWMDAHAALLDDTGLCYLQTDVNGDNDPDLIIVNADGSTRAYSMNASGNRSIVVSEDVIALAASEEAKEIRQNNPAQAVALMAVSYKLDPKVTDEATLQQYCEDLINRWKTMGIHPEDVLQALGLSAKCGPINMDGSFSQTWKEAALMVSGEGRQYTFADWNADGLEELLVLSDTNHLQLHGFQNSWGILSELDDLPENASYLITSDAPVIVLTGSARDSVVSATCAGNRLHKLFSQEKISKYTVNGSTITYSTVLPGSITRSCEWKYQADSSSNRPTRTETEWPRNNYPMPSNANDTIQRYVEAKVYTIPEEAALLTSQTSADGFSVQDLDKIYFPDSIDAVSIMPYSASDNEVLYEVTTTIDGRNESKWYAVAYEGQWKVAGVSNTFSRADMPDGGDLSIRLLCANEETVDRIPEKNGRKTYRILLPKDSRVYLQWQEGSVNESSVSYVLSLYRNSITSNPILTYNLKKQKAKQQTPAVFLTSGVYYFTVDAKKSMDSEYRLALFADPADNIEAESNDTSKDATPIILDQDYSGSLQTDNDIDFYSFRITEDTAVNISLKCSGNGDKRSAFIGAVYNGSTGEKLTTFDLAGNVPMAETGNLYLGSGVYLIQINKGASWTSEEYSLIVRAQKEGVMEAESNNTPATANTIPVNEDVHGSIGTNGDVDCYRFSLDSDSAVQIRFSFASTGLSGKTYVLSISDENQRVLQSVNIGGKETSRVIAPVTLKAGIYTVKVENPQFAKQEYLLRIVCQAVALSESEPNNAAGAATPIRIGDPITGVLSSENDEDYYVITFTKQTTIRFSFSFTQGTSKSNAFSISIERNGKTEWKQSVSAASGGIEQEMVVPAGEYYIRIKSGSIWNGNLYKISIK